MTGGRDAILTRVRSATAARRAAGPAATRPDSYIRPRRARGDHGELVARFREMAEFAGASVETVADDAATPAAVARFLAREDLGDGVILSPSDRLRHMPWGDVPRLVVGHPPFGPDDRVAVTDTVAGVAETGTLLVRSGAAAPNALHLLPEAHIAIQDGATVVGSYEDALGILERQEPWPRAATFITGPSRTADIEKTPQIGVHGPGRLHIILIHGAPS